MRTKIRLAATVALSALSGLAVLPSGAGQHFGIAGDAVAWGMEATAQAGSDAPQGFGQGNAQGFLIWGPGALVNDAVPSAQPITFAGCVHVVTMRGEDFGCDQDLQIPIPTFDPLMQQAHVQATIGSDRFPGTQIQVNLFFIGMEPFLLPSVESTGPLSVQIFLAVGRRAQVSGFVNSMVVGTAQVGPPTPGLIAKGALVQTCTQSGMSCA